MGAAAGQQQRHISRDAESRRQLISEGEVFQVELIHHLVTLPDPLGLFH
jgi:hypothetical protein